MSKKKVPPAQRFENVPTDLYDDITMQLERARSLMGHVATRLETLDSSGETPDKEELYALHLILLGIQRDEFAQIHARAKTLKDWCRASVTGGVQ